MVQTDPDFIIIPFDDPSFASGGPLTEGVPGLPDGYTHLCGVYAQGAGMERVDIKVNDSYETQQIPAVDLAVDANALVGEYGRAHLSNNGFSIMNQPMAPEGKITLTPFNTGTPAGFALFMFGKKPFGTSPYTLFRRSDKDINSSSASIGALIYNIIPQQSGPVRLTRLVGAYFHGATSNFAIITMGPGGRATAIPVRVGAVNTIEHPPIWTPIDVDIPQTINFGGKSAGGTGAALETYFALQ